MNNKIKIIVVMIVVLTVGVVLLPVPRYRKENIECRCLYEPWLCPDCGPKGWYFKPTIWCQVKNRPWEKCLFYPNRWWYVGHY